MDTVQDRREIAPTRLDGQPVTHYFSVDRSSYPDQWHVYVREVGTHGRQPYAMHLGYEATAALLLDLAAAGMQADPRQEIPNLTGEGR